MKLASARSLKEEMIARTRAAAVVSEAFTLRPNPGVFGPRSLRPAGAPGPRVKLAQERLAPIAAFGVAPRAGRGDDYAFAVRVFSALTPSISRVLAPLARHAAELDIAYGVTYRPRIALRAGGSCGHYNITAGTIGGFVEDDEQPYILSNNHVLADTNAGQRGDDILAPGPVDIVRGQYAVIGHLHDWIPLTQRVATNIDAAVATLSENITTYYPWSYTGIGETKRTPVADRYGTDTVVKRGRTTGVTHGVVSAYELDAVAVDYGTSGAPRLYTFDAVIELVGDPQKTAFSQPGDSGSFIFDARSLKPYALLFGGGPDENGVDRTLAHFMPDVLERLQVRIVR